MIEVAQNFSTSFWIVKLKQCFFQQGDDDFVGPPQRQVCQPSWKSVHLLSGIDRCPSGKVSAKVVSPIRCAMRLHGDASNSHCVDRTHSSSVVPWTPALGGGFPRAPMAD